MRTRYIFQLLSLAVLMQGCYKDKGDYDYIPVNHVTVKMAGSLEGTVGTEIVYTPEITFEQADDGSGFEYRWDYTGISTSASAQYGNATEFITISTTKELTFLPNALGYNILRFYVTEKATGYITETRLTIEVISEYNRGWAILSETNGDTRLSFIRPTYDEENNRVFIESPDIFSSLYPDLQLGKGPVKIGARYASSGRSSLLYLIQDDEPVALNSFTFAKEIEFYKTFVDEQYPEGSKVKDFFESLQVSMVLMDNNKVYTRAAEAGQDAFIGRFTVEPVTYNGNDLHVDRLFWIDKQTGAMPLVNDTEKRVYWYQCTGFRTGIGNIIGAAYDNEETVDFDYNDFTGAELVDMRIIRTNMWWGRISTVYKKEGKLRYQQATTNIPSSAIAAAFDMTAFDWVDFPEPLGSAADKVKVFLHLKKRTYIFTAVDNKVYWFDSSSKMLQDFYTFPAGSEIAAMEANPQESELVVCMKDGGVAVLDITHENLMNGQIKYETSVPGNIVWLGYKYRDYSDFNVQNND